MGLRRAVLEKVFKQVTTEGMFSDAYPVTATPTATPKRAGILAILTASAAISKVFLAMAGTNTGSTATGTSAWKEISY